MMARPYYYFRILTTLTLTAAAAVLAALLIASAPASAQEDCTADWNDYLQPDCNQTGVPLDTVVWLATGELDPTTVNTNTFMLVKEGTATPVPASVTYYDGCLYTWGFYCAIELDPDQLLEANTTYTATLKGGENGVKTADGTPYADFSWSFTTGDSTTPPPETTPPETTPPDTTAPTISITSPADGATYKRRAIINASYSCTDTVDSAPQCTAPVPSGSAIDTSTTGTKTFTVSAADSAGNTTTKIVTYYVTKSGKVGG